MTVTNDDIFGASGVPEERKPRYFDLFEVDGWHGVFNPRPERYDDQNQTHKQLANEKGLVIFYEYTFIPISSNGQVITRTCTKNSREWREIFNSLKELWGMTDDVAVSKRIGETYHTSKGGAYVARELVSVGKYTKNGEEKNQWASKIVEIYSDEDACLAAHDEFYGVESGNVPMNAEPPTGFDDRKTALDFLPNFVKMALGENHKVDLEKLQGFFNDNEVLDKHFTLESPEVKEAILSAENKEEKLPF